MGPSRNKDFPPWVPLETKALPWVPLKTKASLGSSRNKGFHVSLESFTADVLQFSSTSVEI